MRLSQRTPGSLTAGAPGERVAGGGSRDEYTRGENDLIFAEARRGWH